MKRYYFLQCLTVTATLTLLGCSSNNDDTAANEQSEFNEDAQGAVNTGEPGGDISTIAGLWNGTTDTDGASNVVYWHLAADGVITRYDYQQDGIAGATGENCYLVDDPVTVTPEDENTFSFFNVAVTAVRNDQTLTIEFLDPDINDLDNNGDNAETPTFNWTLLTTPSLDDLNNCNTGDSASDVSLDNDPQPIDQQSDANEDERAGEEDSQSDTIRPDDGENAVLPEPLSGNDATDDIEFPSDSSPILLVMSRAGCISEGGTVIGDIGNGAIFQPEYRCPSGQRPIAGVIAVDDEPRATEGAVCCL